MSYRSDPKNARKHPDRNKQMIRASLEEVGPFRSIAIDGDGVVRAGNGVYEQAQALGLKVREVEAAPDELIAVKRPDLRGKRAERAAQWDNRAAETAEWDLDLMPEFDWSGMFEPDEMAILIGTGVVSSDVNELWKGMPEFEHEDKTAFQSLVLHFKDQAAVDAFAALVGQKVTPKTRYLWYPEVEIETYADKRYVPES